jgi:hypothetical protein
MIHVHKPIVKQLSAHNNTSPVLLFLQSVSQQTASRTDTCQGGYPHFVINITYFTVYFHDFCVILLTITGSFVYTLVSPSKTLVHFLSFVTELHTNDYALATK